MRQFIFGALLLLVGLCAAQETVIIDDYVQDDDQVIGRPVDDVVDVDYIATDDESSTGDVSGESDYVGIVGDEEPSPSLPYEPMSDATYWESIYGSEDVPDFDEPPEIEGDSLVLAAIEDWDDNDGESVLMKRTVDHLGKKFEGGSHGLSRFADHKSYQHSAMGNPNINQRTGDGSQRSTNMNYQYTMGNVQAPRFYGRSKSRNPFLPTYNHEESGNDYSFSGSSYSGSRSGAEVTSYSNSGGQNVRQRPNYEQGVSDTSSHGVELKEVDTHPNHNSYSSSYLSLQSARTDEADNDGAYVTSYVPWSEIPHDPTRNVGVSPYMDTDIIVPAVNDDGLPVAVDEIVYEGENHARSPMFVVENGYLVDTNGPVDYSPPDYSAKFPGMGEDVVIDETNGSIDLKLSNVDEESREKGTAGSAGKTVTRYGQKTKKVNSSVSGTGHVEGNIVSSIGHSHSSGQTMGAVNGLDVDTMSGVTNSAVHDARKIECTSGSHTTSGTIHPGHETIKMNSAANSAHSVDSIGKIIHGPGGIFGTTLSGIHGSLIASASHDEDSIVPFIKDTGDLIVGIEAGIVDAIGKSTIDSVHNFGDSILNKKAEMIDSAVKNAENFVVDLGSGTGEGIVDSKSVVQPDDEIYGTGSIIHSVVSGNDKLVQTAGSSSHDEESIASFSKDNVHSVVGLEPGSVDAVVKGNNVDSTAHSGATIIMHGKHGRIDSTVKHTGNVAINADSGMFHSDHRIGGSVDSTIHGGGKISTDSRTGACRRRKKTKDAGPRTSSLKSEVNLNIDTVATGTSDLDHVYNNHFEDNSQHSSYSDVTNSEDTSVNCNCKKNSEIDTGLEKNYENEFNVEKQVSGDVELESGVKSKTEANLHIGLDVNSGTHGMNIDSLVKIDTSDVIKAEEEIEKEVFEAAVDKGANLVEEIVVHAAEACNSHKHSVEGKKIIHSAVKNAEKVVEAVAHEAASKITNVKEVAEELISDKLNNFEKITISGNHHRGWGPASTIEIHSSTSSSITSTGTVNHGEKTGRPHVESHGNTHKKIKHHHSVKDSESSSESLDDDVIKVEEEIEKEVFEAVVDEGAKLVEQIVEHAADKLHTKKHPVDEEKIIHLAVNNADEVVEELAHKASTKITKVKEVAKELMSDNLDNFEKISISGNHDFNHYHTGGQASSMGIHSSTNSKVTFDHGRRSERIEFGSHGNVHKTTKPHHSVHDSGYSSKTRGCEYSRTNQRKFQNDRRTTRTQCHNLASHQTHGATNFGIQDHYTQQYADDVSFGGNMHHFVDLNGYVFRPVDYNNAGRMRTKDSYGNRKIYNQSINLDTNCNDETMYLSPECEGLDFVMRHPEEGAPIPFHTVKTYLSHGHRLAVGMHDRAQWLINGGIYPKPHTAHHLHYFNNMVDKKILTINRESELTLFGTKLLQQRLSVEHNITPNTFLEFLRHNAFRVTGNGIFPARPKRCSNNDKFRSFDGSCNNAQEPKWGQCDTAFSRVLPARYSDGIHAVATSVTGEELPNARTLSVIFFQDKYVPDPLWTLAVPQWGQLLSHDFAMQNMDQSAEHGVECCADNGKARLPKNLQHHACLPIDISTNDEFYSKYNQRCMNFVRSLTISKEDCTLGPADQLNTVSSYLDASPIYGSTKATCDGLRTFSGGLMTMEMRRRRFMLPTTPNRTRFCDIMSPSEVCYQAGDVRVNQNPQLAILQTLLIREHNRIANKLAELNPLWDDERIFQECRRIVIAEYQHITYNEWLPVTIGEDYYKKHGIAHMGEGMSRDYNPKVNAATINGFTTGVYRSFHSMVQGNLDLCPKSREITRSIRLSNHYFRPQVIERGNNLDDLIRGLVTQPMQKSTDFINSELTRYLFRSQNEYGSDLEAIDIQRGRDHGIPGYNAYRRICRLKHAKNFDDLSNEITPEGIEKLRRVYAHVDDIDLLVGTVLENVNAIPGTMFGPTARCLISEQFYRSRVGDRYFYDNANFPHSFTYAQFMEIKKASLARLLCDTGDNLSKIQRRAFDLVSPHNPLVSCKRLPKVNLALWKE